MKILLVIAGVAAITLEPITVKSLPPNTRCSVCHEGQVLRQSGLVPYHQSSRMRRATLRKLSNGSYSRSQSAYAMNRLLGSPYAIDTQNGISYYPMETDPSTYVGVRYTRQKRWDGQFYYLTNQSVPYQR